MEWPPASFRNSRKKGIHLNQKRGKNESDPFLKHFIPLFGAFCSPALKRISLHLNHQPLYSDLTKNKLVQHEKRDFISCCTGHLFVFLRSDFWKDRSGRKVPDCTAHIERESDFLLSFHCAHRKVSFGWNARKEKLSGHQDSGKGRNLLQTEWKHGKHDFRKNDSDTRCGYRKGDLHRPERGSTVKGKSGRYQFHSAQGRKPWRIYRQPGIQPWTGRSYLRIRTTPERSHEPPQPANSPVKRQYQYLYPLFHIWKRIWRVLG